MVQIPALTVLTNVGLGVTREQRGQRSKPRSRDTNGRSQRPLLVLNKSKTNETCSFCGHRGQG